MGLKSWLFQNKIRGRLVGYFKKMGLKDWCDYVLVPVANRYQPGRMGLDELGVVIDHGCKREPTCKNDIFSSMVSQL